MRLLLLIVFCCTEFFFATAQTDTSNSIFQNSQNSKSKIFKISEWSVPKKASVLSAVFPGAGQVYNKKYWKVPIIYIAGGFFTYNITLQHNKYLYYKKELISVLNGGISKEGFSSQQLSLLKNQSKKWRDLSIAGLAIIYVLNIIDANVDAHLRQFDVSDNLSFAITPYIVFPQNHNLLGLNTQWIVTVKF